MNDVPALPPPYSRFEHECGMPLFSADQMHTYAEAYAAAKLAEVERDAMRWIELLREADYLIHAAKRAAGKLNVEMNLRRSMPSWAELEALTNQRDAMYDWTKRKRSAIDAAMKKSETPR